MSLVDFIAEKLTLLFTEGGWVWLLVGSLMYAFIAILAGRALRARQGREG